MNIILDSITEKADQGHFLIDIELNLYKGGNMIKWSYIGKNPKRLLGCKDNSFVDVIVNDVNVQKTLKAMIESQLGFKVQAETGMRNHYFIKDNVKTDEVAEKDVKYFMISVNLEESKHS